MRIREAEASEVAMLAETFWHPLAERMERYSELNALTDDAVEMAVEEFESLLEDEERTVFLLEDEGAEVGFVAVEFGERPTREKGKYATVTDLYVKEAFRGRGYGTKLLERVETLAATEDCDYLDVSAEFENHDARAFYENAGYDAKQVTYAKPLD
ncbi:GNAT family N-acetyltransferase [Natronomonas gomsonensis]|jgi:GNAT superfamily N-acetyltransferase|uniref:GNAT family N-acetyltransferase n=1 Tax=Natronomonas gomsonensis TaxID=1046043 RepID=UPI0020CA7E6A|nr:GNAT family N-acetyltransferase [Natronomonas gomsonensis]MCY4731683.1 GNAT family N-acetyltransferase [Natronomonas gomsonensis]